MIKTRFDDKEYWVLGNGKTVRIQDLSTQHLMNIVMMFYKYPSRTMGMLVNDVESCEYDDRVWTSTARDRNSLSESIHNITAMSSDELIQYAMQSPLGEALCEILRDRGVDIENVLRVADLGKSGGEEDA